MAGTIIDIAGAPRHLRLSRGSISISDDSAEIGRIDLDGVTGLLISSLGATITTGVFSACADRHIPVILCNQRYQPQSVALPIASHSDQNRRQHVQAQTKIGLKNQIWKQIVKSKITNQLQLLQTVNSNHAERVRKLAHQVTAGDKK